MSDPLNGLKPHVHRAPFSLEMVTVLAAFALLPLLLLLLPLPPLPALQEAASRQAATTAPIAVRRLMSDALH